MEVAFFTDSYDPMKDGVAAVTGGLARTIVQQGHSVQVYTPQATPGASVHDEVAGGVRIHRLRSLAVPLYSQYRWALFPLGLLRHARGAGDADVVHLHTPGPVGSVGFLAARRFGRPLVGTFHTNIRDMQASVPRKLLIPLFFRVAWWYNLGTYLRCDAATAPSPSARDALERSSRKPFRHPVTVVPNGIDVDRFRPGATVPDWRSRCGFPSGPLITYLGRLTADKGVHRFLDAVAELAPTSDLHAIVGGRGPEEAAVRERLARDPVLRAHVRYVGPVAEEEKAALLGQTDLFVLPSTSDTSSIALLEAMACGATVVAPAVGGAADVVQDGVTGRRVDVLAPGALPTALRALLDDSPERRRLARQAMGWARTHASLETMAQRFISLYRLVQEERPPRARSTGR